MILKPKDLRALEALKDSPEQFDFLEDVLQQGLREKRFTKEEVARDLKFVTAYAYTGLESIDYSKRARALDLLEAAAPKTLKGIDSYQFLILLLEARLRDGKTREALVTAERVLEIAPYDVRAVRLYVIAAVAENRRKDAVALLHRAIAHLQTNEDHDENRQQRLMILWLLQGKLEKSARSKRTLAAVVADLADPVFETDDMAMFERPGIDQCLFAVFRELTRSIVTDPEKLKKVLRILKSTEPQRTSAGLNVSTSALQAQGFKVEFNLSVAEISMLEPEAMRMLARAIVTSTYGLVDRVRVADPFVAEIYSKDGTRHELILTNCLGPTCSESLLTGDEPLCHEISNREALEAINPRNLPDPTDRKGWLAQIAKWTATGDYHIVAQTLEDLPATKNLDFELEHARAILLTPDDEYWGMSNRKRAIELLEELDGRVTNRIERARVRRLLGMAYIAEGCMRDAFEMLFSTLNLQFDSTALHGMGRALRACSEGLPSLSFEDRALLAWSTFEESGDLLEKQLELTLDTDLDPCAALETPMGFLDTGWLDEVWVDEDGKPAVQFRSYGDTADTLAMCAFLKRIPPKTARTWTFVAGASAADDLDDINRWLHEEMEVTSLHLYPKYEDGKIRVDCYAESKKKKSHDNLVNVAHEAVITAVGEGAFMAHCVPEVALLERRPKARGLSIGQFRKYFFEKFPNARGMTLDDVPVEWKEVAVDYGSEWGDWFFTDIKEVRATDPDLFHPSVFFRRDVAGLDLAYDLERYGATTATIAFDVVRKSGASKKAFMEERRSMIDQLTAALEKDGHALVIGTAVGDKRAYVNAVLWQPDRALLNAALMVKNTPSIAWAAYKTIFPGTTPFALAVNNVNQARSAFKTFEVRLPDRADETIETLQSSCRRSAEKRKALADEARKQRGLLEDATSMVTAAVDALSMAEIDDEDFRELLDALDIDPEDPVEKLHAFYATEAKA